MPAKLSNFENLVFDKATTVWYTPGVLIFSTHYASTCTRADLSLHEHPECRVVPSNKNIKSRSDKLCIRFEQNVMKYYKTFPLPLATFKTISFFAAMLESSEKKYLEVEMSQQKCTMCTTAMSSLQTALFHWNSLIVVTMKLSFKVVYQPHPGI